MSGSGREPAGGRLFLLRDGSRDRNALAGAQLERHYPDDLYVHVLRSPRYAGYMCEIAPAGVTKWSGIKLLAHDWGIADEEICAVGDDVNDIPMIRAAGLGVAMGNAQDEVKAAADRICPGHDDDGLAEVVTVVAGMNCTCWTSAARSRVILDCASLVRIWRSEALSRLRQ